MRCIPGEMIRSVELAAPLPDERALYKRAISRSYAEWPLVEVCARAVVKDGAFQFIRLTAGGIAPVPLRLSASEAVLQGKPRQRRQHRQRRQASDDGRKAAADDRLQARSAGRRGAGCSGAAGGVERIASRCAAHHNEAVVLRESGGPSTPRPLGFIAEVSGILDRPLSRAMTVLARNLQFQFADATGVLAGASGSKPKTPTRYLKYSGCFSFRLARVLGSCAASLPARNMLAVTAKNSLWFFIR